MIYFPEPPEQKKAGIRIWGVGWGELSCPDSETKIINLSGLAVGMRERKNEEKGKSQATLGPSSTH